MRMPRATIRRMMAAVAVVAVLMGAWVGLARLRRISAAYHALAEEHAGVEETLRRMIATEGADSPVDISPGPGLPSIRFTAQAAAAHEAELRRKYERAARYPWMPVGPDSPMPIRR
jgi:hypothetical protein